MVFCGKVLHHSCMHACHASNRSTVFEHSLVAIGGVGGSGTRVIAQCLQEIGFYMGDDLNESKDNLWFTLLFNRLEVLHTNEKEFDDLLEIFLSAILARPSKVHESATLLQSLAAHDREHLSAAWLRRRVETMLNIPHAHTPTHAGWKAPNTHIVLERMTSRLGGLRYIHVIRNGLDMAFSNNQNQARLWGPSITGRPYQAGPAYSLHYWRRAHERVFEIGREMTDRFLVIRFEDFCQNPIHGIRVIGNFAGIEVDHARAGEIAAKVRPPESIGRYRKYSIDMFDPHDVAAVSRYGFTVS